jgi:hypothetical protein
MLFAKRVYYIAGIYGLLALLPQYFLEEKTGRDYPPAVTHPEYFYGFVGVAVAWQVAFLIIASDPVRFRPLMPATFIEKATFGLAVFTLYALGRVNTMMVGAAAIDMLLCTLFIVSYVKTARPQVERGT